MKLFMLMQTFADNALHYFFKIDSPGINGSVEIINPYKNDKVKDAVIKFYKKYFYDNNTRIFIFGINPGRFGGGLTGVAFTDPVALREKCGIKNDLGNKKELSSKFIYKVIDWFGGVKKFYSKFFLTAIFPLAITKNGKNYNYYDDKELLKNLFPFIKDSFIKQTSFGAAKSSCICLGKKNYLYLKIINDEIKFFKDIIILEHPRYIMQYKLKDVDSYCQKYLSILNNM